MKQLIREIALIIVTFAGGFACGLGHQLDPPRIVKAETRRVVELPKPGKSLGVWRVTGYCLCSRCCGIWSTKGVNSKNQRITASGKPAKGLIIAAPPIIPFGTRLSIPGYGVASVEDRGGAIKGRRLDVLFTDKDGVSGHQRALNWGVQHLEVRQEL